ncbi:MAG: class I SAM-dependent methyltransferase [Abditibacteriaceae bacterium]
MPTDYQDQFTSLAPYYDELMAHVPYSAWVDYVLNICKRYKHAPKQILDCACGTGNVTYELAARGFDVMGVDYSEEMIEVAQHKNKIPPRFFSKSTFIHSPKPTFVQSDLCEMELNRQFDTITCLYDSLNYLTAPEMLRQAFTQINKHLQPGGLFIFDMNSPYAFETDMFTQSEHRPRQKLQYDWISHYDRQTRLCQVEMTYSRRNDDGEVAHFKEKHCERSYTMDEIRSSLQWGGLHLLETFDSYRLVPPHARSERWYFVASNQTGDKR